MNSVYDYHHCGYNDFENHLRLNSPNTRSVDDYPESKVHGANMGPIWGRQDPGGPNVGPMNFAIWVMYTVLVEIDIFFRDKVDWNDR